MDHRSIEADGIVERYVTGRLESPLLARFEEHYLDCPRCIAAIEDADLLERGLRLVATEDAGRPTPGASRARSHLPWLLAAVFGGLALALVAMAVSRRISALEERLAVARAPQANTPIISLGVLRDDGREAEQRIRLAARAEWWVVMVPVSRSLRAETFGVDSTYRVTILKGEIASGETVWHTDGAVPDAAGNLMISVHSSWLAPGSYRLLTELEDGAANGGEQVSFALLIEAPAEVAD